MQKIVLSLMFAFSTGATALVATLPELAQIDSLYVPPVSYTHLTLPTNREV